MNNESKELEALRANIVSVFINIANELIDKNASPRSAFHRDLDMKAIDAIMEAITAYSDRMTKKREIEARIKVLREIKGEVFADNKNFDDALGWLNTIDRKILSESLSLQSQLNKSQSESGEE